MQPYATVTISNTCDLSELMSACFKSPIKIPHEEPRGDNKDINLQVTIKALTYRTSSVFVLVLLASLCGPQAPVYPKEWHLYLKLGSPNHPNGAPYLRLPFKRVGVDNSWPPDFISWKKKSHFS